MPAPDPIPAGMDAISMDLRLACQSSARAAVIISPGAWNHELRLKRCGEKGQRGVMAAFWSRKQCMLLCTSCPWIRPVPGMLSLGQGLVWPVQLPVGAMWDREGCSGDPAQVPGPWRAFSASTAGSLVAADVQGSPRGDPSARGAQLQA